MKFKVGDVICLRKRPHGAYFLRVGSIATVTAATEGYYKIKVTPDYGPYKGRVREVTIRREVFWDILENEE